MFCAKMRVFIFISSLTLVYGQYYYNDYNYNKFRPSPVDPVADKWNIDVSTNDAGYNYPYQGPLVQQLPYADFALPFGVDKPPTKPLFTPAETSFPAATQGQIDNYNQALQEEAEEAYREAQKNQLISYNGFNTHNNNNRVFYKYPAFFNNRNNGFDQTQAQSYVDVRLGGNQNYRYRYNV